MRGRVSQRGHHLGDPLVLCEYLIVQFLQERHLVINGYLVPRCLYAIEIVRTRFFRQVYCGGVRRSGGDPCGRASRLQHLV